MIWALTKAMVWERLSDYKVSQYKPLSDDRLLACMNVNQIKINIRTQFSGIMFVIVFLPFHLTTGKDKFSNLIKLTTHILKKKSLSLPSFDKLERQQITNDLNFQINSNRKAFHIWLH